MEAPAPEPEEPVYVRELLPGVHFRPAQACSRPTYTSTCSSRPSSSSTTDMVHYYGSMLLRLVVSFYP